MRPTVPSRHTSSTPNWTTPAPTPSLVSRPVRRWSPTAAPTSSSPRRTPAAMTSSRTWSRARRPSTATRLPRSRRGPLRDTQRRHPRRRRQPDQPRRRPLRRDSRQRRLEHVLRRHPRRQPVRELALLLDPRRRRRGSSTFAFGGPDICTPCFADGSSGIPVHLPDGELVQGMQGSIEPPTRGHLRRLGQEALLGRRHPSRLQLDLAVRADGNDSTGDVSIYDRDLAPERPRSSPPTPRATRSAASRARAPVMPPAMATGSPSSTSPKTAPAFSSARGSPPTPRATATATSTCTSAALRTPSTSPPARSPAPSTTG